MIINNLSKILYIKSSTAMRHKNRQLFRVLAECFYYVYGAVLFYYVYGAILFLSFPPISL